MTELKVLLSAEFYMKDVREVGHCIGLKITRNKEWITIRLSRTHEMQNIT